MCGVLWDRLIEAHVMFYCSFTCFLLSFVNVYLNVLFLFYPTCSVIIPHWSAVFYRHMILPLLEYIATQIVSFPELYECLNKLKIAVSTLVCYGVLLLFAKYVFNVKSYFCCIWANTCVNLLDGEIK